MHGSGGPIAFYQQVSVVGCTGSVCSAPLFVEIFPFFCQRDVQNGNQSEIVAGDEEKSRTGGRVVFSQMNWHGRVRQDQTNNTMELIEWEGEDEWAAFILP